MKLAALAKLARGGMGLDEVLEALESMGMKAKLTPIAPEAKPSAECLEAVAAQALKEGAKFFQLDVASDSGNLVAFVVLKPA